MAENMCVMVTTGNEYVYTLTRAIDLAAEAVGFGKRTVIYLDLTWKQFAKAGALEKRSDTRESAVKLRTFLNAGGQLWVSSSPHHFKFDQQQLLQGAQIVDDRTLMAFLTQDTQILSL